MANLLGKNELLYIKIDGVYMPIGCLTTNSINYSVDMTDGTVTKCDLSPAPIMGRKSYEISFEAVAVDDENKASYNAIEDALNQMHENNEPIDWKIETILPNGATQTREGEGFLTSLEREAPVEGEITFSGTIQGFGEISKTNPSTITTTI